MLNCMAKFFFVLLLSHILLYRTLQNPILLNLINWWPFLGINHQQTFLQLPQLFTINTRDRVIFCLYYFLCQHVLSLPCKWWFQTTEFILYHSDRPNICCETIRLAINYLWRQIIRSAYKCLCYFHCMTQHLGDSEISQFNFPFRS